MTAAHPLRWPDGRPRVGAPQRSQFVTSFARARDGLLDEIRLLGGKDAVVTSDVALRRDGLPYANLAEPPDRGVAVYFARKGRSLCFACDRWDRVRDNLQAIRKTIEALRGVERWGSGVMVEQAFDGFAALPPPAPAKAPVAIDRA